MTVTVNDTFTETSDTQLISHTPDTAPGGSVWNANSGLAVTVLGATDNCSFSTAFVGGWIDANTSGNQNVQFTANAGSAANGIAAFGKRDSSAFASVNAYAMQVDISGNSVSLYEWNAGVGTEVDGPVAAGVTTSGTYTYEIEYASGTVTGRIDSADKVTIADSTHAANTWAGFRHLARATGDLRLDNFVVDDLAGAAASVDVNVPIERTYAIKQENNICMVFNENRIYAIENDDTVYSIN